MSEKTKQQQELRLVKPFSALEWAMSGDVEPTWLIEDFLPEQTLALVSGPRKLAYKTWFIMMLGTLVATGRTYLNFKATAPAKVLFVEEEGSTNETKSRLRKIFKMCGVGPDGDQKGIGLLQENLAFMHWARVKLDDPEWVRELLLFTKAWEPKLIVLDALTYMSNGDENKKQDMQVVIDSLAQLRRLGACVMFVYHTGQREQANVDLDVRGSTILADAYDVHLALRRTDDEVPEIKFFGKYRDFGMKKSIYSWHHLDDGTIRLDVMEAKKHDTLGEVLKKLKAEMQPGMAYNLQDFRRMSGLNAGDAATVRAKLIKQGDLEPVKGGKMIVLPLNKTI